MKASHLIHSAVGGAAPCDSVGVEIPKRGSGHCAACGASASFALSDTISENFVTVKNASRAWSHGGDATCAACVFAARTLRLRCAAWWATSSGVRFWRTRRVISKPPELREQSASWWGGGPGEQPDGVLELCSPPDPPFVAAIPLAGISHGGETHAMRAWWPGETEHHNGRLVRLQSKHAAIYARVGTCRERYPLQIDDQLDAVVDVALWLDLHRDATALIVDMADAGVWNSSQRSALLDIRPPQRAPLGMVRDWNHRVRLLRQHASTAWWPLFVGLLPTRNNGTT